MSRLYKPPLTSNVSPLEKKSLNLKASLALPSPTFASANKGSQLVPCQLSQQRPTC